MLITAWYVGLTAVTLAVAYRDRGIGRVTGILIIAAYVVFTGSLLIPAHEPGWSRTVITVGTAAAVLSGVLLASGRGLARNPIPAVAPGWETADQTRSACITVNDYPPSADPRFPAGSGSWKGRKSLVPGWPVRKLWFLGLEISVAIAIIDAVLGHRVILIGLLIAGPCCAVLTGRWIPAALTGFWVIGLAVLLGLPDGIWGTRTHLAFLAPVITVAIVSTLAAALIEIRSPPDRPARL